MSRRYMVEVHVKAPQKEHDTVCGALKCWGMSVSALCRDRPHESYEDKNYLIYEGEITLCGGDDEHDCHLSLKELIPFPITTKWSCVEFFSWDEVIRDEEEPGG